MGQAVRLPSRYSRVSLDDGVAILNYLYFNDDECFVRVMSKSKSKVKTYPISSLKEQMKLRQVVNSFGKEDLMFSLNSFRTMSKATRDNIFCINAIAVDVDYKTIEELKDLDTLQVIKLLELDFFDSKIPTPNLIEHGNQIRLIYKLSETVYVPKNRDNVLVLARRISEVFADHLKDYGAEKQNLETYFRFPGSINSKNNSEIKFLNYDGSIEYTLGELQELWLEELPSWYKKKKGKTKSPRKVVKLHNLYAFNTNRLIDFELIQDHLNNIGVTELRSKLCFLYRNYTLIKIKYQNGELKTEDYDFAESEMLKFNSKFNYPLRDNVIESATRVVNHRQYVYKNDTLLNFLNESSCIEFDYDLCEKIGLQSIYKVKTKQEWNKDYYNKNKNKLSVKYADRYNREYKEKCKEKYKEKLNKNGEILKKDKLKLLYKKIKTLKGEGFKNKKIALECEISIKTLERHITIMKKNGLLQ